jgi:Domain of unknown function (DUF4148)
MKNALSSALLAAVLATPLVALAQQPDAGVRRAQVSAELVRLEHAGYHPARVTHDYPTDIQSAMARVQDGNGITQNAATASYRYANGEAEQAGISTTAQR